MSGPAQVAASVGGRLGRITLRRPEVINALTLPMIRTLDETLERWEDDAAVDAVLLDGEGERGFCAGADIVALRESALGDGEYSRIFWREEYRLNARIATYPKPVVVLMDGIVMGGGVGLSGHASHRVATERLVWAMPEATIGFAPDVGGTFLLSRVPGEVGIHVGLTSARVGVGDALALGFADHFVASAELPALVEQLQDADLVASIDRAAAASGPLPAAPLAAARGELDHFYAGAQLSVIAARLAADESELATEAAAALAAASPTSTAVVLAALRRARDLPGLRACLEQEYRTSCSFLGVADFVEGIRAAVVDKDRSPRWQPDRLEVVTERTISEILAGPPGLEPLWP